VQIAQYQATVKQQVKLAAEAKRQERNMKRKKQRLMKKAAALSSEDLLRIAVVKRCGLYDPAKGPPAAAAAVATSEEKEAPSASSGSAIPSAASDGPAPEESVSEAGDEPEEAGE
jgi:hypothetical protein